MCSGLEAYAEAPLAVVVNHRAVPSWNDTGHGSVGGARKREQRGELRLAAAVLPEDAALATFGNEGLVEQERRSGRVDDVADRQEGETRSVAVLWRGRSGRIATHA